MTKTCPVCATTFDAPWRPDRKQACSRRCGSVLAYRNRGAAPLYDVDPVLGCWNWKGALTRDGYARSTRGADGRQHNRYRIEFERAKGPIAAGMQLDHLCRNRRCINPAHLEPVTAGENSRRGVAAKLTRVQVEAIRLRLSNGERPTDLAREFGVGQPAISNISSGRSWRDGSRRKAS